MHSPPRPHSSEYGTSRTSVLGRVSYTRCPPPSRGLSGNFPSKNVGSPYPSATLTIARQHASEILPLAVNCLNKALESAVAEAQMADRVFSPQNWAKSRTSIQGETLVASTVIGMLPSIGGGKR